MEITKRQWVVALVLFLLIGLLGTALSISAPFHLDADEHVYLLTEKQRIEGTLPDAYMLSGVNLDPYFYPRFFSHYYETIGHTTFKSMTLVALILLSGSAALYLFTTAGLVFIPALLASIIALMPRFSMGLETFGVLTFRESIGRSFALPLFFLVTALLFRRIKQHKSLWPIYGILGILLFIHPVTIVLFAFMSLLGSFVAMIWLRSKNLYVILLDHIKSGVAFMLGGAYFFIVVFQKLSNSIPETLVNQQEYIDAVMLRAAWEFPSASIQWLPHMAIISFFFLALFLVPRILKLQKQDNQTFYVVWGGTVAIGSVVLAIIVPAFNLYLMEHFSSSYVFQEWNRISKFFYLGLFVALIPTIKILWDAYQNSAHSNKKVILSLFVVVSLGSSSFGFEWFQFIVGYPNVTQSYIPKTFSGEQDSIRASDYEELCEVLKTAGVSESDEIISKDYKLRYYCKSDLLVTFEEGAAYLFLGRNDLVAWKSVFLEQKSAIKSNNPQDLISFAKDNGIKYIVDYERPLRTLTVDTPGVSEIATTSYFKVIILHE